MEISDDQYDELWESLSFLEDNIKTLTSKLSILWKAFELLEQDVNILLDKKEKRSTEKE